MIDQTVEQRIFRLDDLPPRIAARILVNPETGCWEWQGALTPAGYGAISWEKKPYRVHRLVYTLLAGPIPDGLVLDHVKAWGCESRACCWPAHLEPVTNRENTLRGDTLPALHAQKTHCPQGHPYDEENTYLAARGRECRTCRRASNRSKRRTLLRLRLRPDLHEAASRMAAEDGTTFSPWISALIAAEAERRAARERAATHE